MTNNPPKNTSARHTLNARRHGELRVIGQPVVASEPVVSDADAPSGETCECHRCSGALLTAQEVADLLRLSDSTVYELAKDGSLAFVQIGRRVRFHPSHVEDFIAASTRGGQWS